MQPFATEQLTELPVIYRIPRHELLTNRSRRHSLEARARRLAHRHDHRQHSSDGGPLSVILCIAGVIPRGSRFAWPLIEQRFVAHLRAHGHAVDAYGFSLHMGDTLVDGVQVDQRDLGVAPFRYLEEANVSDVDAAIAARCRVGTCPRFEGGGFHDTDRRRAFAGLYSFTGRNAVRQLVSENRVGEFLLRVEVLQRYDVAIVWWAGFYPWLNPSEWSIAAEVARVASLRDAIVLEQNQESHGRFGARATDGFYIGKPHVLSKLCAAFRALSGRGPRCRLPAEQRDRSTRVSPGSCGGVTSASGT